MNGHTPGPWKASPYSGVVGCAVTAQPDPKENTRLISATGGRNREEVEANARLIAAAPDLLEALGAIGELAMRMGDGKGDSAVWTKVYNAARAAVAKARSVEP